MNKQTNYLESLTHQITFITLMYDLREKGTDEFTMDSETDWIQRVMVVLNPCFVR